MKKAGAVVAVLALVGIAVCWGMRNRTLPVQNPKVATFYGNVEIRRVNASFRVGGRVDMIAFDEGDFVGKGETLASLDKRPFEADLASASASRDAAKAELERLENGSRRQEIEEASAQTDECRATLAFAEAEFARNENLLENNAVSESDYDSSKSARDVAEARLARAVATLDLLKEGARAEDVAAAKAKLERAEAELERAKIALEDTELKAPNDGVVLTRVAEEGAMVSAGQTLATLSLRDVVWVYIFLEETDLGKIAPGMKAEISTDSSDKVYTGRIGYISPEAEFTPKTVETPNLRTNLVYRARIIVETPDEGLRQGAPVDVRVALEHNPGAQSKATSSEKTATL